MGLSKRDRYLRKRYSITEAEYERLLASNDGRCWICNSPPGKRRLHVEHDHSKKGADSIRGITCWHCNLLLSRAKDSPDILRAAADYLESDKAVRIIRKGKNGSKKRKPKQSKQPEE